jgi:BASS family bile acid:Na+ symporter
MIEPQMIDDFTLELGQSSEIGLALSLAIMMFSVALELNPSSFIFLRRRPKAFLIGIFAQLIALPVLTIGLCMILKPLPSVALGMILISCCPGGNVSNMLVLLARGNTALSVSLTATSSIAAAFITPIAVLFWSGLYPPTAELLTRIDFDAVSFLIQTAVILALPLLLGIACNVYFPKFANTVRRPLVVLSTATLLVIIVMGSMRYWDTLAAIGVGLIGVVAIHNALAFLLGNTLGRFGRVSVADRRALTYEVGIQNSGLGIVILLTQMGGLGGAAVVAGLWGTWHIVAGIVLVIIFRTFDKMAQKAA